MCAHTDTLHSGSSWRDQTESNRSTSILPSPTSYAVCSECSSLLLTQCHRPILCFFYTSLGIIAHDQQRTGQDMELRDADRPQDVRGDRCPRPMCPIYSTKELGTSTAQLHISAFSLASQLVLCFEESLTSQFVSGSDDFQLRVYNISTGEKITSFEAHPDYIRCLTVHPTLSLVLTGSDDMTIKCWDWDKGWRCVNVSIPNLFLRDAPKFLHRRLGRNV